MDFDNARIEELITEVFPLKEDIKIEVIVALLMKEIECEFRIQTVGQERRAHKKDLDQITFEIDDDKPNPVVNLKINRNGLYDLLPQMLFHKASTQNQLPDSDSFEQQVKYNANKEESARIFFQPLETIFNDLRVLSMSQEISLLKNQFLDNKSDHFMEVFWDFDPSFTVADKSILVQILPFLVNNKNQIDSINFCLSRLCGNEIQLTYRSGKWIHFRKAEEELTLIDARLGYNTVLGSSFYYENALWIDLNVNLNSVDEYPNYLKHSRQRKLIDFLMSYILPMEVEFELSFNILETVVQSNRSSTPPPMVLGINAKLENFNLQY